MSSQSSVCVHVEFIFLFLFIIYLLLLFSFDLLFFNWHILESGRIGTPVLIEPKATLILWEVMEGKTHPRRKTACCVVIFFLVNNCEQLQDARRCQIKCSASQSDARRDYRLCVKIGESPGTHDGTLFYLFIFSFVFF